MYTLINLTLLILALGLICLIIFFLTKPFTTSNPSIPVEQTVHNPDITIEPSINSSIVTPADVIISTSTNIDNVIVVTVIIICVALCTYGLFLWLNNDASNIPLEDTTVSRFSPEFQIMIETKTINIVDALKVGDVQQQLSNIVRLIESEETQTSTLWAIHEFINEQLPLVAHNQELVLCYTEILNYLSGLLF